MQTINICRCDDVDTVMIAAAEVFITTNTYFIELLAVGVGYRIK